MGSIPVFLSTVPLENILLVTFEASTARIGPQKKHVLVVIAGWLWVNDFGTLIILEVIADLVLRELSFNEIFYYFTNFTYIFLHCKCVFIGKTSRKHEKSDI